jgi:hypothetical protein
MEPVNISKSFEVISRQVNAGAAFAIAVTCLGICGAYLPTNTARTSTLSHSTHHGRSAVRQARSRAASQSTLWSSIQHDLSSDGLVTPRNLHEGPQWVSLIRIERTRFKRSPARRDSRSSTEWRGRPARAYSRPREQVRSVTQEEPVSEVRKQLENVKRERGLLQRRLQYAEDYVSKNYPAGTADRFSATPPRFNTGDPDMTGEYGINHTRTNSTSQPSSDPRLAQGFSGGNTTSQPPWQRTPRHDPDTDKSKHDKERDARLKVRDSVAAIARARHARRVIEYLQQCPDAAQKYDETLRLIEGCSGFAPPSCEDLWQRLIQLSKTIASAPQDARY